jgi:hypothetical protein
MTINYTYMQGISNVHHLLAPYDLLVKAFGNDGTVTPRDDYKSMAEWDIETDHGTVEVYDYKVGKCYDPDGLERHEIAEWHVQGDEKAVQVMLGLLETAVKES